MLQQTATHNTAAIIQGADKGGGVAERYYCVLQCVAVCCSVL